MSQAPNPPSAGVASNERPSGAPPSAVPQGGQAAAPPAPAGAPPASPSVPGKTMGIVAFIMSFFVTFFLVQIAALILGIVALVQSRRAGHSNGWALAAIIISAVLMVGTIIVAIILGMAYGSGRW